MTDEDDLVAKEKILKERTVMDEERERERRGEREKAREKCKD